MPRIRKRVWLGLAVCVCLVQPAWADPAADADSPAARWQALSDTEKTALVRGVLAGSQLAVDIAQRHFRVGLNGLTALPEWIQNPLDREVYKASARWAEGEGMRKAIQRAGLSGKPEDIVPRVDGFYREPRNARIDHAWAVWAIAHKTWDDQRRWAADKLLAIRSWSNLQWLNRTRQRERVRPTLQWDRSVGQGPFGTAQRPDGMRETYYSLDPYYAAAMFRVADEVSAKSLHLQWHYDRWRELGYRPMIDAYRRMFDQFFARRDDRTGLVETRIGRLLADQLRDAKPRRAHGLDSADWSAEFIAALGDDSKILAQSAAYLDAVWRYHWLPGRGLYGVVDLENGKRLAPGVKINDYGRLGNTLAQFFHATGDTKWRDRVLELNQFVWDHRRNPQRAYVPLFLNAEKPDRAENVEAQLSSKEAGLSDDSDSIYYIRDVFRQYQLTKLPLLKEMVCRHGRDYIDAAWLGDSVGHFTRHWWINARPLSGRMYGDGRFNSNYQMALAAHLAETPNDKRYFLDYLDKQLATFRKLDSVAGLFGQQFLDSGRVEPEYGYNQDDWGIGQSQEVYADILLAAYEASGERRYLDDARQHVERMLEAGPQYWNPRNASFPAVAARLARGLGRPGRVEIPLGGAGATLRLARDGKELFAAAVPTEVAVVYLPPGAYSASIGGSGQQRRLMVESPQPADVRN